MEPPRYFEPFLIEIDAKPILPHFLVPKVEYFDGSIKTFHSHMLISGGNNALKCKMFIGTLLGVALDWFSGILDRSIVGFEEFFATNKQKTLTMADLFDVR